MNNLEYIVRFNTKQDGEDFVAATTDSDTKVTKWIRVDIAVMEVKNGKDIFKGNNYIAKYVDIPQQQVRRI